MEPKQRWSRYVGPEFAVFAVSAALIAVIHSIVVADRLALGLCYLVAVGSAYALAKRDAPGLASAIVTAAMFAQLFAAKPYSWNRILDAAPEARTPLSTQAAW